MADALPPEAADRDAVWHLHRLEEPTFSDVTRGVFLGVVWCAALWTPMFVSVLLH